MCVRCVGVKEEGVRVKVEEGVCEVCESEGGGGGCERRCVGVKEEEGVRGVRE